MQRNSVSGYVYVFICLIAILFFQGKAFAQCLNKKNIWDSLYAIEKNPSLSASQKLYQFYSLKNISDKCGIEHDSVYCRILLRIGVAEIKANKNYTKGFDFIQASLNINNAGKKGYSKFLSVVSYFNLAFYYDELGLYSKALNYYDSTITLAKTFPDTTVLIAYSTLYKTNIFFRYGDYQKIIEEGTSGINYVLSKKDSLKILDFLNQRAQAFFYINNLKSALSDVETIVKIANENNDLYDLASALKIKAFILSKQQKFTEAEFLFKKVIDIRIQTDVDEQVANDYLDYGNFLFGSLKNYRRAKKCYDQAILYGNKAGNKIVIARALINTSALYSDQENNYESAAYCVKALKNLSPYYYGNKIDEHIYSAALNSIGDKELLLFTTSTKSKILLNLFLQTRNEKYLNSCLTDCLITDTLITKMRNMQSGSESKLYWRDYTRSFYTDAIQASYLLNRPDYAFYFMEKSRAVLLNDKLNELNAASYLSPADAGKQENYEIKIIELQQKLSALHDSSKQYQALQLQLANINNDYEQFIKSLEQKYPSYYQYKYADRVASLSQLQQYLAKNHQSFVHYFFADTVTYILGVTPTATKFIRLSRAEFSNDKLDLFLQFCANRQMLNNNYGAFSKLSNSIYQSIFSKLQLPAGRVIVCTDNIVIPFEALCTDAGGKNFLLNDYSFNYVYSARFLMQKFSNYPAKGNFAGYAPVSFEKKLGVVDLKNAATAIKSSAGFYDNDELFTHKKASRSNFFKYAPLYSIVGIFSHAKADTTDNEPVLFMQDSLIYLSELQLLNNPATKLVLLSACQTNVGKSATGEGIFSLARGFATAGIPSVSATLWKADEATIYAISEKFNQYLAEGMNKDEALQKAKRWFIQNNNSEKTLPYYWANMILIGNTDAIALVKTNNTNLWPLIILGIAVLAVILLLVRKNTP